MAKKKIIITGSLGYVGSVLAPYLLERGYEVRGFDTGFFKDALLYPAPPYDTVIKDARDITKGDLKGFDALVHLAAISNDPFGSMSEEEVYGPTRGYANALASSCKELDMDFIFASSCSVYGAGTGKLTDEDGPVAPLTPYSRNKLAIEKDLAGLADDSFSPIALRFATAYGLSPRLRLCTVYPRSRDLFGKFSGQRGKNLNGTHFHAACCRRRGSRRLRGRFLRGVPRKKSDSYRAGESAGRCVSQPRLHSLQGIAQRDKNDPRS